VIIAVGAGLASAFFYALCSVLQHRAAGQVPVRGTFSPALMLDLVRHPVWLLGTVSDGAGLSMQALALGFGPVALVQPLLVTGLLFAVVLTATLAHRRPHGSEAAGAVLCVAGVAAFLFAAQPANGVSVLSWRHGAARVANPGRHRALRRGRRAGGDDGRGRGPRSACGGRGGHADPGTLTPGPWTAGAAVCGG